MKYHDDIDDTDLSSIYLHKSPFQGINGTSHGNVESCVSDKVVKEDTRTS